MEGRIRGIRWKGHDRCDRGIRTRFKSVCPELPESRQTDDVLRQDLQELASDRHVRLHLQNLHTYYVDEKAIQKGHVYLSTFLDQNRNVVFVAEGNDSGSVGRFRDHLESKNGKAEDVKHISSDMGSGYLKGAKTYFPNAKVTLDHFHVMQHMTEAVNDVRRREYAALVDEQDEERRMLKGQRYLFLKNYKNLDEGRKQALKGLMDTFHDLGRIYVFKEGHERHLGDVEQT